MSYEIKLTDASFWIDREKLEELIEDEKTSYEDIVEDDEFWLLRVDRDGNVHDIDYKTIVLTPDMEATLDILAPYVKAGSYIELEGDDGATGRYEFDGTRCVASGKLLDFDGVVPRRKTKRKARDDD